MANADHHDNGKESQDQQLREMLRDIDLAYDSMGDLCATFKKAFHETQTTELVMDEAHEYLGAYFTQDRRDDGTISNRIYYSPEQMRNFEDLACLRFHEGIHAMQYTSVTALQTYGFKTPTNIRLTPRSFVWIRELAERDAYGKESWLMQHFDQASKKPAGQDHAVFLPQDIDSMRSAVKDSIVRLTAKYYFASASMEPDGSYKDTSLDRYHKTAIDYYDTYERGLDERDEGIYKYCRLGEEDIRELGDVFGLNPFVNADGNIDPFYLEGPHMRRDLELQVGAQSRERGIWLENKLPTLGEALRKQGLDRAAFKQQI